MRETWFGDLANRFVVASKKKFEDEKERKAWHKANAEILRILHAEGFTGEQMMYAERWIMRGDPCQYRDFIYRDFFPTEEQLASIGIDVGTLLERAEAKGEKRGHELGYADGYRAWEKELEILHNADCVNRRTCENYKAFKP